MVLVCRNIRQARLQAQEDDETADGSEGKMSPASGTAEKVDYGSFCLRYLHVRHKFMEPVQVHATVNLGSEYWCAELHAAALSRC